MLKLKERTPLLVCLAFIIGIGIGYMIPHEMVTQSSGPEGALLSELAKLSGGTLETKQGCGNVYLLKAQGTEMAFFVKGNETVIMGSRVNYSTFEDLLETTISQLEESKKLKKINVDFEVGNLTRGNGSVILLEFSDFDCPGCEAFYQLSHEKINELIEKGLITHAYRSFPLSYHPYAQITALAAKCAAEQNKFWEYYDILFGNRTEWRQDPEKYLKKYAEFLRLNVSKFEDCLKNKKYESAVEEDRNAAIFYGAQGTPSLYFITKNRKGAEAVLEKYATSLQVTGYETPSGYVIYVFGAIGPDVLEDIVNLLHG